MTTPADPASGVRPEQRAALQAAKLDALVDRQWGHDPSRQRCEFGAGAATAVPGADGGIHEAWVHPVGYGIRALGAALVWAVRHRVQRLHLLVDEIPGAGADGHPPLSRDLARRASYLAEPRTTVWAVPPPGAEQPLWRAEAAPLPVPPEPQPAGELVDLLLDAGVELVLEAGMLRGEVNGLEVARIVHGQTSSGEPVDGAFLEVGVGAADRELTATVHAGASQADHLTRVVELVREHRSPGAAPHPLNRLVPERWLRARAVREPELLGLAAVKPAEGPHPRTNLTESGVAVARGRTGDGTQVVLAFSTGADVDVVPAAADARALVDPVADLWLVVPEGDAHGWMREVAGHLTAPARVVTVPGDWRA